jgi:succinylarginine dihydrolase
VHQRIALKSALPIWVAQTGTAASSAHATVPNMIWQVVCLRVFLHRSIFLCHHIPLLAQS